MSTPFFLGRYSAFEGQPEHQALFLAVLSFLIFYLHVQCKPFLTWVENEAHGSVY